MGRSNRELLQSLFAGSEGFDVGPGLRAALMGGAHPLAQAAAARFDAWVGAIDPEAEIDVSGVDVPGFGGLRGPDGFRKLWLQWMEEWLHYSWTLRDWSEVGEHVTFESEIHATGRRSGAETTLTVSQLWTFRDGKVIRWRLFRDRAAALAAIESS